MELETVVRLLTDYSRAVPCSLVIGKVPTSVGLYSFFLDDLASLPLEMQEYQTKKELHQNLIYVGKAYGFNGLLQRLINQDLLYKNQSKFFRSLGAMLGYLPPRGCLYGKKNRNYLVFSMDDRDLIRQWIRDHILVNYLVLPPEAEGMIRLYEKELIKRLRPVFNIENNPEPCVFVKQKKENCLQVAREKP